MTEKSAPISLPVISEPPPAKSCGTDAAAYTGCDLPADAALSAAGWQKRFVADPKRAQEAVEMYEELGYQVKLAAVNVDTLSETCGGCKIVFQDFKVVYTRKA